MVEVFFTVECPSGDIVRYFGKFRARLLVSHDAGPESSLLFN